MNRTGRRRVLFISYLFPPTGGVGVQRATKFVKYLPEFGWDCSVLTAANPSAPLRDESLLGDIPAETVIHRARTLEPGYAVKQAVSASGEGRGAHRARQWLKRLCRRAATSLLQPDPQILWRPAALRLGRRILKETHHDAIIATGPPFSSLLLGATLARESGAPLVLDYRDEWGISNAYWENRQPGLVSRQVQQWLQHRAVRAARVLLATTPSSAAELGRVAAAAGSTAETACIYNGFDPPDFASAAETEASPVSRPRRYRLAFLGTLWALNPIEPLVEALLRLNQSAPQLLSELELVLAGRRTAEQEQQLDRLQHLPCAVVRLPFVSHAEACRLMRSADGLLLLNADRPDTHRIINAKTFEYLASKRPIFVIAPPGDLWDVVRDLPGTVLATPRDPGRIAEQLSLVLEQHRCGVRYEETLWDVARFERRSQAGELAALLDRLIPASAPSGQRDRVLGRNNPALRIASPQPLVS
jgi:hypothetical protein